MSKKKLLSENEIRRFQGLAGIPAIGEGMYGKPHGDREEEKEDEKKEIKASAKDKVKDMDMKEDVAALTDGEELSEEFKAKAATIFESAVKAKLVEEIEKLEGEYETKVAEKVEETKEEIVEKVFSCHR